MPACLNAAPDVPRVLKEHGYEFVLIDLPKAVQLFENSKNNPPTVSAKVVRAERAQTEAH